MYRYMMKYMNLTCLKNNVFMVNSGFSVRQNQDSESVRSNCEAVHFRITVCLSTNRELKIYDVKAATTPQILHIYGTKTKALHFLHVFFFYFCTFLSRSRQICDVKWPFLKCYRESAHIAANLSFLFYL